MQVAYTTATGTEIDVTNGSLTFDVSGDFVFDPMVVTYYLKTITSSSVGSRIFLTT